ncbi:hypothetical protein GGI18_000806 [Coemansia linderi]|uniref:Uncharacterized protein n=1 Tax=Coemansia linderi TaxID=2663919 RepID=A0ACC1KLN7_9FUNG|nr:hypothetical protein GGI18_000806 [Coemansia linderi]
MPKQRRDSRNSATTVTAYADNDTGGDSESSAAATGEKRKRQVPKAKREDGGSDDNEEARAISAQEEADLSSALIAKLLAEDSGGGGGNMGYYADYGNEAGAGGYALDEYASGSEPDEEWDPNAKGRRASKSAKARKQQAGSKTTRTERAASPHSDSDGSEGDGKRSRGGQKRKKHKAATKKARVPPEPVAPGQFRSGAYTDDEERMFNEGLELFGRSWSEISGHVGTRDAKSIRSHAQKYFIKLFRDGVALPAKVKESGEGYTLSGRPLDPNSAAARPYLQHVMDLDPLVPKPPKAAEAAAEPTQPLADSSTSDGVAGGLPMPEALDPAVATDSTSPPGCEADAKGTSPQDILLTTEATHLIESTVDSSHSEDKGASTPPAEPACLQAKSPVRTEYAMSRPQRSHARPVAMRYDDPHQMVRCTPFQGQPLSGVSGSQPFRLVVHTNAQLQMDFHAHLMLSEVIGLLGGRWDATSKVLTVTRAFPCAALESEDAHTNVEMDPGSELVVRHQIMGAGLRVVGWYHSHPTFRPDPSIIDIENQTAYQTLFRDGDSSEEPFVGAIVGPYDPELPGPVSVFNWFYVGRSVVDRGHPKRLVIEPMSDAVLPVEEREMLLHLLDTTCGHQHCAALEEAWRPSSTELRSLKMAVSLARRMPWLLAPAEDSEGSTPATSLDTSPGVPSCSASDCTAASEPLPLVSGERSAEFESIDKQIPAADLLAGKRAVQDPLLMALSSRFPAGVFKAGPDGKLADAPALERVYAAYFLQWD